MKKTWNKIKAKRGLFINYIVGSLFNYNRIHDT